MLRTDASQAEQDAFRLAVACVEADDICLACGNSLELHGYTSGTNHEISYESAEAKVVRIRASLAVQTL